MQQSLLLSSSSLGWFWLQGHSCTANRRLPTDLTAALQGLHVEAVLDPARHLSPIPPRLLPPLLALFLPGEGLTPQQDCQQSHGHYNISYRHLVCIWAPPTTKGEV